MDYRIMLLLYTYKCSSKCDICTFSCGPERSEKMDKNFAKELIRQAKDNKFFLVGFAGGEPLVFKDEIMELSKYSRELGMRTTITSNCFWATSYEEALSVVQEMKESGVSHLKISSDDFHNKYVPYDNIKNVLMACKKMNLKTVIGCTSLKNSKRARGMLEHIEDYSVNVNIIEQTCYPLGRAADMFDENEYIYNRDYGDYCRDQGILTVTPEGKVYPCGSMCGMVESREIKYSGKVDLKNILELAGMNKHIQFIAEHGIKPYIKYISEHNMPIRIPEKYIDTCDMCYRLFSRKENVPILDNVIRNISE
ncbi:radical SAM protein [Faecalimonas umbilicata]|jgi:MoaA/NifB/PqqE/SkfB family radical SAM enzyme|uniref:radical SAM protein n=1 Tax=Faecalimonas umbilicata TaxID=1912855 RepID=UPI0022E777CC|nr:radical SAM protein [Faecalimonas umbilicata]